MNYDLPWNPNRIEQRFGRVHRIGQTEVCHMWSLVAAGTREGQVYARLLAKVEEQRKALGGQVFDVLGQALTGRELRELLVQAVRYGDRPEVRARLDQVIDDQVGAGLGRLVAEQALAADVMSIADVERVRAQMEEAEARRLQPHYVQAFFVAAFGLLGGRLREREPGRFQVTHVPAELRGLRHTLGAGAPVLPRYERIAFDKSLLRLDGRPPAELVAPSSPAGDLGRHLHVPAGSPLRSSSPRTAGAHVVGTAGRGVRTTMHGQARPGASRPPGRHPGTAGTRPDRRERIIGAVVARPYSVRARPYLWPQHVMLPRFGHTFVNLRS